MGNGDCTLTPCLTETPDFQNRLRQAYVKGGLVPDDTLIFRAATQPAAVLVGDREVVLRLIFALERFAAILGEPHPCLSGIHIDWMHWPHERWIAGLEQHALAALFQVTQSPFGAEFAADTHQLRPRLFRIAQQAD